MVCLDEVFGGGILSIPSFGGHKRGNCKPRSIEDEETKEKNLCHNLKSVLWTEELWPCRHILWEKRRVQNSLQLLLLTQRGKRDMEEKKIPLSPDRSRSCREKNPPLFYFYVHCLSLPTAVIDETLYSDLMDDKPPYGFVFLLEIHTNNGCLVGI